MKFKDQEIKRIKQVLSMFTDSKLIVYYAKSEQIKQLKEAGLKGVSRMQNKV